MIRPNTDTPLMGVDEIIARHEAEYAQFRADLAEKVSLLVFLLVMCAAVAALMWATAPN